MALGHGTSFGMATTGCSLSSKSVQLRNGQRVAFEMSPAKPVFPLSNAKNSDSGRHPAIAKPSNVEAEGGVEGLDGGFHFVGSDNAGQSNSGGGNHFDVHARCSQGFKHGG